MSNKQHDEYTEQQFELAQESTEALAARGEKEYFDGKVRELVAELKDLWPQLDERQKDNIEFPIYVLRQEDQRRREELDKTIASNGWLNIAKRN